ncbi:MAG: 50S ribosomal protein L3 N(5)-glutamine methyltransferase [Xanthobacteraceae bacterium]|nr:50S ribosomal protein L3 N(5)-glutamine methyltransferase [Xanthobacteraceae bacterium]
MAKRAKSTRARAVGAKPARARTIGTAASRARTSQIEPAAPAASELATLLDYVRYAVSRFNAAELAFAHGTTDPVAEAVFVVCESLHLRPDQFDGFAVARVTTAEGSAILALIEARIRTRKPAAYLLNKIYMLGLPFYVDERVIVPRSFIGELLQSHFGGDDGGLVDDPGAVGRVLDLCTGSGCLAILAARQFPNARVDAVDVSRDALEVAARNLADYRLQDTVALYHGDLYAALPRDARYDLIVTNPPYVDAEGMANLPPECRHEPVLAFDGGADGLDVVRRILAGASRHLVEGGGLVCEIGRGRAALEDAFPDLPFLWLDTEESEGEVFWLPAEALAG